MLTDLLRRRRSRSGTRMMQYRGLMTGEKTGIGAFRTLRARSASRLMQFLRIERGTG